MNRDARSQSIPVTAEDLAAELAQLCPEHGLDLAGAVTLPAALPFGERYRDWLAEGRHADLEYLARDPAGRLDPTAANPWARSLLVFGQRYTDGWPAGDEDPTAVGGAAPDAPWTARVARYARGRDYHDVLLKAIKRLAKRLAERWPGLVAFPATDTGPYLEREWAWLAGLGFLGRNTCLIHERLGSGFFLGVAPTNLLIDGLPPPGAAATEPLYGVRAAAPAPAGPGRRHPLRHVHRLPRGLPHRCPGPGRRPGCAALPFHLDHRVAGAGAGRQPRRPGRAAVRLRHLPGGVPLEPAGGRAGGRRPCTPPGRRLRQRSGPRRAGPGRS